MKKITIIVLTTIVLATIFGAFTTTNALEINNDLIINNSVERWAVLVGDGDIYGQNDVIELNNTLVSHGWQADHIKVLTWPQFIDQWYILASRENIINAIHWMEEKEDEDDIVLFFFAGHGEYGKILDCSGNNITCEELNYFFASYESKNMVLIFHCCFSGSMVSLGKTRIVQKKLPNYYNKFIESHKSFGLIPGANIENEHISKEEMDTESYGFNGLNQPGRVILMSSGRFEISYAHIFLENGIFAYYLIKALEGGTRVNSDKNNDGWISAEEAYKYARPRTTLFALLRLRLQHPKIYDGYEGELNLVQIDN